MGGTMKKLITKLIVSFSGIAAILGFSISDGQAQTKYPAKTEKPQISESTPLYLEHGLKLFADKQNDLLAAHWSHSSHVSHSSHSSHVSHHSHYSG